MFYGIKLNQEYTIENLWSSIELYVSFKNMYGHIVFTIDIQFNYLSSCP